VFQDGKLYDVRTAIRRLTLNLLPKKHDAFKILHFSDVHLKSTNKRQIKNLEALVHLKPDLVVATGDFISSSEAIAPLLRALDSLLDIPGVYVFGSNDYFESTFKNPISYFEKSESIKPRGNPISLEEMIKGFADRGWINLNNQQTKIRIKNNYVHLRGTDDAHLNLDQYEKISGDTYGDISIGVTHSPYKRVLNAMSKDKIDIVLAGHTHGGQIRIPWIRGTKSLVTNCDLPNSRSRGLTKQVDESYLNVSAGLGQNPYFPIRIFCPPEVTLLTIQ
jgi:predicted MPP superfamily phosphohydrolase